MNSGKKICIVVTSLGMGGMERASSLLATQLHALGSEVSFITLYNRGNFFDLPKDIKLSAPENFNVKKLDFLKTLQWMRKAISAHNPDAILVFGKFNAAVVNLSLLFSSFRIFLSERSTPFYTYNWQFRLIHFISFTLRSPLGIIAQTSLAAKVQRKYYGANVPIEVIPNPLRDVKIYTRPNQSKIILAAGRLDEYNKGFDLLITSFSKVPPGWTLMFAGSGDSNHLSEKAKALNVIDRISFLGPVKDIDDVFARAEIFVMPSRTEGFPNVLVEAMAAGLPCVSSRFHDGVTEIIEDGVNGIIVENGNTVALTEVIVKLIADQELRKKLSSEAVKIKDKLKAERVAGRFLNFLEKNS